MASPPARCYAVAVVARVFLSYASPDRAKVLALRQLFQAADVDTFVDAQDIRRGTDWERALAEALETSDVLLVVWSARAAESEWVAREYTTFLKRWPERKCAAVQVDETPLPPALAKRQAIDALPLASELLDYRRRLEADGVSPRERRRLVRERARALGVDVDDRRVPPWVWWILAGGGLVKLAEAAIGAPVVATAGAAVLTAAAATVVAAVIAGAPQEGPQAPPRGPVATPTEQARIEPPAPSTAAEDVPPRASPSERVEPATRSRMPTATPSPTEMRSPTPFRPALIRTPAGTFMMGSPPTEAGRDSDEVQHRVEIPRGVFIGATEVTQAQWTAVMGANPSYARGDDLPVEGVSWFAATEYLNKLSAREGIRECYPRTGCTGDPAAGDFTCPTVAFARPDCAGYRLPSEEEWEYAARAGTTTPIYSGEMDISPDGITSEAVAEIAWYRRNSGGRSHPVGGKGANPWGLYDVFGNVWEWVDGRLSPGSAEVVYRGCGFGGGVARFCRAAYRGVDSPADRSDVLGFRPARSALP